MAKGFRGVKDDLSELCRSFLDISCFLRPLLSAARSRADTPPPSPRAAAAAAVAAGPRALRGVLSDLAEFGGALRTGLSRLSGAPRAAGLATDGEVSDGIREFVEDLVKLPESLIEFPVPIDDLDFHLSSPQRDHVEKIECLIPKLADLRASLCPAYMSENKFWKLYFISLHPRLSVHDSELLSTQQIVEEVRQIRTSPNGIYSREHSPDEMGNVEEEDEQPIHQSREIEEISCSSCPLSADQQPENHSESDVASYVVTRNPLRSEDDASFSDTEDDGHVIVMRNSSPTSDGAARASSSSDKRAAAWLRKRLPCVVDDHRRESSDDTISGDDKAKDWLKVEDSDFELL